jgi:hypothetical protein
MIPKFAFRYFDRTPRLSSGLQEYISHQAANKKPLHGTVIFKLPRVTVLTHP